MLWLLGSASPFTLSGVTKPWQNLCCLLGLPSMSHQVLNKLLTQPPTRLPLPTHGPKIMAQRNALLPVARCPSPEGSVSVGCSGMQGLMPHLKYACRRKESKCGMDDAGWSMAGGVCCSADPHQAGLAWGSCLHLQASKGHSKWPLHHMHGSCYHRQRPSSYLFTWGLCGVPKEKAETHKRPLGLGSELAQCHSSCQSKSQVQYRFQGWR